MSDKEYLVQARSASQEVLNNAGFKRVLFSRRWNMFTANSYFKHEMEAVEEKRRLEALGMATKVCEVYRMAF